MPRKTTGCWTCRARKKKCDDGRPSCGACSLRAITCYGYGAKPGWMDGGDLEKSMLCAMKLRAKESYSLRRRSRASRATRHGSLSTMATASPGALRSEFGESPSHARDYRDSGGQLRSPQNRRHFADPMTVDQSSPNDTDSRDPQSLHESHGHQDLRHAQDAPSAFSAKEARPRSWSPESRPGTGFPYSETELSLLMYYFDHVFPRLCPFFTYSAGDKGRGWLLSLFLRTKPLCAAAICISACDQAQFVLGPLSDIPQPNHDLEMKHIQIVIDLRAHLAQLSQQTGASRMAVAVEALACIMHLILFELWIPRRDIMNDWVMHLDAASALLSSVDSTMVGSTPAGSPMTMSSENNTSSMVMAGHDVESFFPVEFLSDCEKSAFDFFITQFTYCFVNAAVGRELTPRLAESIQRTQAIFHKNQSKIKDMFGLEDWVLITMLDVAVLKEWKQRERSAGTLSLRELTRRADVIEARINDGLARMASTATAEALSRLAQQPTQPGLPRQPPTRDERIHMITSTYLNSVLLLLHVVVSGFYPNLPEIRRAVLQALGALEYMRAHCDINIPSWPFCVAGCLALESEYPRFRALLPPPKVGHHPLVLTQWTLSIIERCWQLRSQQSKTEETVDWVTAMNDLGTRLLLL